MAQIGYNTNEKVWYSTENLIPGYSSECSIGQHVINVLKQNLENVLQISDTDKKSVTNEQMLLWAVSIATQLKAKFQLTHEDIIGIIAVNSTYMLPVELACLFNTTPFHAINPSFPKEVYEQLLSKTRPIVIFCDSANYNRIALATQSFGPAIYTIFGKVKGVPMVEELIKPMPLETMLSYMPTPLMEGENQTVAILCSSGTTGPPKAVCIPNHFFSYISSYLTNNDVMYSSSNLDWGSGLYSSLMPCFSNCTRIITIEPFSPEYFAKLVQKYKINYATLVYFHVQNLINSPLKNSERLHTLNVVSLLGAKVSTSTLQRLHKLLNGAYIALSYALSEFGVVTFNITDGSSNCTGKLATGVRACIVNNDGHKLGPNEVGEILVNNGYTWKGYYNDIEATKKIQDSENWLHTGDIGFFDDQEQLHVVDRKKEICKYEGHHYSPSEIEDVINELPDVADVCVIGMNGLNGDAATAAVVKRAGSQLSAEEIKKHVKRRLLMSHMQLHGGVWFFDELPYNRNGKQLKREVSNLIIKKLNKLVPTSKM